MINLVGNRAAVCEKPEVKKAGGVYYTPTYVVRYLVQQSLAPLLAGRSPNQVAGLDKRSRTKTPVRVIDPACGSGSFLIEAYQQLLDWYLSAYVSEGPLKHAKGKEPKLYQSAGGEWRLAIAERRRILLSHIYGVDLDSQAVEVTKLSLCLKLLEGETKDAIARQMDLFHTRALPDLHGNVKGGNSLVGSDAFDLLSSETLVKEEDLVAIAPFDWNDAFPLLRDGGSFDAIVGNPPYLPIFEMRKELLPYYQAKYETYQKRFDAYALFLEAISKRLMGKSSRLGLIIPSSLLQNEAFSKDPPATFPQLDDRAQGPAPLPFADLQQQLQLSARRRVPSVEIPQSAVSAAGIGVRSRGEEDVLKLIASGTCVPLGQLASTYQGIVTGADDVFISKGFRLDKADKLFVKPFLFGSDVSEFLEPSGEYDILYVTKNDSLKGHPKVETQLRAARDRLERPP